MRYLSPRKIPDMSRHHTGQAVVRFVGYGREGRPRDVYLGAHGSVEADARYEEAVRDWSRWSLEVGSAPAGWKPAETGHEGVLTVGQLVEGYRRHLAEVRGEGWQRVGIEEDRVPEYEKALERGWEKMRTARRKGGSVWDRDGFREGKERVQEARRRYGHLDEGRERRWTVEVLDDLLGEFGRMAAAILGDRELRQLRKKWGDRGRSVVDRQAGMGVVTAAYCHVIGREPWAPWNLERGDLERRADTFGLDLGIVRAGGRWVRTG